MLEIQVIVKDFLWDTNHTNKRHMLNKHAKDWKTTLQIANISTLWCAWWAAWDTRHFNSFFFLFVSSGWNNPSTWVTIQPTPSYSSWTNSWVSPSTVYVWVFGTVLALKVLLTEHFLSVLVTNQTWLFQTNKLHSGSNQSGLALVK